MMSRTLSDDGDSWQTDGNPVKVTAPARMDVIEGQQAAIHTITCILAESKILDDALEPLLCTSVTLFGWDIGAFWSVDTLTDTLRCRHLYHKPGVSTPWFAMVTLELALNRGEDLAGRAWRENAPVLVPNLAGDPASRRALTARQEGVRTGFAVPICVGGEVRAVLEFFSRATPPRSAYAAEVMGTICAQVGQFLRRLHAEDAMYESERRVNVLLANAPIILLSLERDGLITVCEGRALQILDKMPGEFIGRSIFDICQDYPALRAGIRRALTGETVRTRVHVGAVVFEVHMVPKRSGGQVIGLTLVATPIMMLYACR